MSCTPSVPRTDHASANDCIAANPNVDSSRRSSSVHEFFISNTIFTGGYESMTRGHVMEKMVESGGTRDSSSTFSSLCSIPGCDGKAMCHPRTGDLVSPCECGYTVCRDCYIESMESGGKCGGCKHIYIKPQILSTEISFVTEAIDPMSMVEMMMAMALMMMMEKKEEEAAVVRAEAG